MLTYHLDKQCARTAYKYRRMLLILGP